MEDYEQHVVEPVEHHVGNSCEFFSAAPARKGGRAATRDLYYGPLGQEGDGRAVGKAITGTCNLGFLFIIVTGSYLRWPKSWTWKHLRPIVFFRHGLSPKARDFNWHNVFCPWFANPLFLIVATATFLSHSWISDILYALAGEHRPQRGGLSDGKVKGGVASPSFDGLDALFEQAETAEPDWKIITLQRSENPSAPVMFTLDRGNGFRPDLRSTRVQQRETGKVLSHDTYVDMGSAQSARIWIRWLHTGVAGGLAGQTLCCVASLAACFLVYTGWMLGWRRFRAWHKRRRNAH